MDTPVEEEGERDEDAVAKEPDQEDQPTHCVVDGAHAFILGISSFLGLAPLKFESRGNGYRVTVSNCMCVYSYIFVTVVGFVAILWLLAEIKSGRLESGSLQNVILPIMIRSEVLIVVLTSGIGISRAPQRMRHMVQIMQKVALVDGDVGFQYSVFNERKRCAILVVIMLFLLGLIIDDIVYEILQSQLDEYLWKTLFYRCGSYLLIYVMIFLELQFAIMTLVVRSRFQKINEAFSNISKNIDVPISSESRLAVPMWEPIRHLISLHSSLCDAVDLIDSSYGLVLMMMLTSNVLNLIIKPYFIVLEITVSCNKVHFLVVQLLWCAIIILSLFVIVEPPHHTVAEAKRTEELMSQLIISSPSSKLLQSRLQLLSQQLMLQTVSFSPMGMCTLDNSLLESILGVVVTYLILLIQYHS